jgi:hypothetical protein
VSASNSDDASASDHASDNVGAGESADVYVVTMVTSTASIDAAMTCASRPPGYVTTYTLTALE